MNLNREYDQYWELRNAAQSEKDIEIDEPYHPWHVTAGRILPDLTALRVLEIGCGVGSFALWMSQKAPNVSITAIDFSQVAIMQARKKSDLARRPVAFAVSDGEAICFRSELFNVVVSCECLEHVPCPEELTNEIYRMLVPGGRFIVTTENYFNGMILAWIKSWLTGIPYDSGSGVQPHEHCFVFWRVKHILEQSGLIVDGMESNHFQWLLLPRIAPAKLCKSDFKHKFLKRLFRPFGRHFAFSGYRPKLTPRSNGR